MANLVQIAINGTDNTDKLFKQVGANAKLIQTEFKPLAGLFNTTGNIASVLGQQHFAQLSNQAQMLAMSGRELIQVFGKLNLVKASLIGLAIAGGAFLVERVMAEKEAEEKRAEAIQKTIDLYFELHQQTLGFVNAKDAEYEAEEIQHRRNLERIRELIVAGAGGNQVMEQEDMRHTTAKFSICEKAIKKDTNVLNDEEKKKLALQQNYAQGAVQIFGNLAGAAAAFGKKGFGVWKALKIGEAIASTYAGAARAFADYPWPYSIAVAAAAVAGGLAAVAQISAVKPGGQAHGGLEYVPEESTFLLSKGERVIQPRQNAQLQDFLDRGSSSSGGSSMMVTVNLDGRALLKYFGQASADGRLTINARAIA